MPSDAVNMNSVQTGIAHLPPTVNCNAGHPCFPIRVNSVNIKQPYVPMVALIYPPPLDLLFALCSPNLPCHSFITHYPTLTPTPSLLIFHSTMVISTCTKIKLACPAAPVMNKATKQKAGNKTKPPKKWVTKEATIKELQAHLTALDNPDEVSFSKEPLVH